MTSFTINKNSTIFLTIFFMCAYYLLKFLGTSILMWSVPINFLLFFTPGVSIVYVLDKEGKYLDFPTLINKMIKNKKKISSFMHQGLWIDIGTTEEYLSLIENLDKIKKENPMIPISV